MMLSKYTTRIRGQGVSMPDSEDVLFSGNEFFCSDFFFRDNLRRDESLRIHM